MCSAVGQVFQQYDHTPTALNVEKYITCDQVMASQHLPDVIWKNESKPELGN